MKANTEIQATKPTDISNTLGNPTFLKVKMHFRVSAVSFQTDFIFIAC